jgi:MFS family permease
VLLDAVVYFALLPRLPFYVHEFGLTKAAAGLLYGAYPLLSAASSLPAGALADRFGPRLVLACGLGLFALASAGFAVANQAWEVWAARGLQGLGAGVTAPVGMAVIASSASRGRVGSTLGFAVAIQSLATVAGPLLGGLVVPAVGARVAFGIPAVLALVVLVWLALDPSAVGTARIPPTRRTSVSRGVLRNRNVRAAASMLLAIGAVGGGVEVLALLALRRGGLESAGLGLLLAAGATIGLVASFSAGRLADRRGLPGLLRTWASLIVGLACGFALATNLTVLTGVLLVAWVAQIPAGGTLAYARGSEGQQLGAGLGTGYGLSVMAWSVGAAVGPAVIGATAGAGSDAVAYGFAAVLAAVLVLPAFRSAGSRDRLAGEAGEVDHGMGIQGQISHVDE